MVVSFFPRSLTDCICSGAVDYLGRNVSRPEIFEKQLVYVQFQVMLPSMSMLSLILTRIPYCGYE